MFNLSKKGNNRGFTLTEILVASAIFVLVLSVLYGIYFSGLDIWDTAKLKTDLQAQARAALTFMVSELRNATRTSTQNPSPNAVIASAPNNKDIQFYLPADKDGNGKITDADGIIEWNTNDTIQYQYIPGLKIIRRLEKGAQMVLAQDVSDVQFIDINIDPSLNINEIKIILTVNKMTAKQRSVSITLSSIVRLRN